MVLEKEKACFYLRYFAKVIFAVSDMEFHFSHPLRVTERLSSAS
jgi:hypothetical protein